MASRRTSTSNGHCCSNSPEDRNSAANASTIFQRALVEHFHGHGPKIDKVGDLVRNCRPPGTFNHKSDPPKPVRLVRHDPSRVYATQQHAYKELNNPKTRFGSRDWTLFRPFDQANAGRTMPAHWQRILFFPDGPPYIGPPPANGP